MTASTPTPTPLAAVLDALHAARCGVRTAPDPAAQADALCEEYRLTREAARLIAAGR